MHPKSFSPSPYQKSFQVLFGSILFWTWQLQCKMLHITSCDSICSVCNLHVESDSWRFIQYLQPSWCTWLRSKRLLFRLLHVFRPGGWWMWLQGMECCLYVAKLVWTDIIYLWFCRLCYLWYIFYYFRDASWWWWWWRTMASQPNRRCHWTCHCDPYCWWLKSQTTTWGV